MRLALAFMAVALYGFVAVSALALLSCEAVTETVTVTFQSEAPATTSYSTITSYSNLTSYATVSEQTTLALESAAVLPSSSGYYYIDNDGTTSWLGGVSPSSTYSSYVTQTVEITVYPMMSAVGPEVTVVETKTLTFTPPPVTSVKSPSTSFSYAPLTEVTTSYLTMETTLTRTVLVTLSSSQAEMTSTVPSVTPSSSALDSGEQMSRQTITGLPTTSTVSVLKASASICNVSSVDVTTNVTYTVYATPTAGHHNQSSALVSAATATASSLNATGYSFSGYGTAKSAVSLATGTSLTSGLPVPFDMSALTSSSPASSSTMIRLYTNSTSSTMATPTACGEHGDFTLTWDDEPDFTPTSPVTNLTEAPPVFNPYHHLYFSDGYVYIPPPSDPFPPISAPRLVMFLANETGDNGSPNAGGELSGEIGAGIRRTSNAFWFNAYGAYLGCDNEGPNNCTMRITGLVYQQTTDSEVPAYQQNVTVPACPGFKNCQLQQVKFAQAMKALSGIRIEAFVGNNRRSWFMDNLALGWYNNTCEAGLLRARSQ